ncbi:hypothetical protein [uncultured Algibacter sp.]|uniref:hypothetical protein n=1 Tax=uncultured Algibacter sp. TaxID=298659 RepID=UPI00262A08D3|nr:hypothetical protein [uncultured Algibacter sp.]
MSERLINIKEVTLKNNCPECYSSDGLRLNFKQKIKETKFYKSITPEVINELNCITCDSVIYPVQWTNDIERVVAYQKRAFTPKKASTYLKKMTWIAFLTIFIAIALIVFLILYVEL